MTDAGPGATPDAAFWQQLDHLVASCPVVIDRPKGGPHPRYPHIIYPLDYGYLGGTQGGDGDELDVWIGSLPTSPDEAGRPQRRLVGVIITVHLRTREVEAKLLLDCSEDDMQTVLRFFGGHGAGVTLLRRPPA